MITQVEANVDSAHTLMAASLVSFWMFLNQTDHTRLQDLLFLRKCSCVRDEGEPVPVHWWLLLRQLISHCLLLLFWCSCLSFGETVCFGGSQVCFVSYFFSVIQVLPSPWDACCCHFWWVSCFNSEDLSSSCCHCLHFLLRFLFFVARLVLSLSLPVYRIFVLPVNCVQITDFLAPYSSS